MDFTTATKIRLVGDTAARTIDGGSLTKHIDSNGPASVRFAWTEAGIRYVAAEHAVVEITF